MAFIKFENPPKAEKTKHDNYCKKAYERYFGEADKKIHNYSDNAKEEYKQKLYYQNIENYILKQ